MAMSNRVRGQFNPEYVTGTISANNTAQGGAAPANSTVEIDVSDAASVMISVAGTHGGVKSLHATIDDINWFTLGGQQTIRNEVTGAFSGSIAANATGLFSVDVSAYRGFRVSAPATGTTGAAQIAMLTGEKPVALALDGGQAQMGLNPGGNAAPSVQTNLSAATTNPVLVKNSAGRITKLIIVNYAAAPRFLKLYNLATAPVPGTSAVFTTFQIAASSTLVLDCGPDGLFFGVGIGFGITGAMAENDATAIAAGDVRVTLNFY